MGSLLRLNDDPTKLDGASVVALALRHLNIERIYGIVGIPVIEIGLAAQTHGIAFYATRNEQAASYAAGIAGYLEHKPGVCLVVGGPGVVHALAGLSNAWSNAWPMLLIAGAAAGAQESTGAFQEAPQMEAVRPWVKYAGRPDCIERIPFFIEKALRTAISGRPGPVYVEIPADQITGLIDRKTLVLPKLQGPAYSLADSSQVAQAIQLLKSAQRPLVVVGKGMAYARAEKQVRELIDKFELPFLATPMGKGVVSDRHINSVAAARSYALENADLIVLMGARLNWIMHFGAPPRYAEGYKLIQIDVCAEEIGNNKPADAALVGDGQLVIAQLLQALQNGQHKLPQYTTWKQDLQQRIQKNIASHAKFENDDSSPMSYYRVFKDVKTFVTPETIVVSEGANTLDIGRGAMLNELPRHRIDAGTFGTMGIGMGFAIAAQAIYPEKRVLAVEGDSAFGFSAMELEVAVRYKMPIVVVVVNNSGVYTGVPGGAPRDALRSPPTALGTNVRYDLMCSAIGGLGYFVERPEELKPMMERAVTEARAKMLPAVVNVIIASTGERKPQKHSWLTQPKSKL